MSASILTLTRVEATKLARQPATWILTIVLLVYLLVVGVSFYAILRAPAVEGFDRETFIGPIRQAPLAFTASLFSGTVNILVIILAATIVGQEYSRGTLRTLLLAGATRRGFGLAKITIMLLAAAILAIVGTAFSFVAIAAFGAAIGERLLAFDATDIARTLAGLFVAFAGWSILATTATLWRGSLGLGIGTTIGLLIVGDLATGLLASMGEIGTASARLLPNAAFAALNGTSPLTPTTWAWVTPNLAFYLALLPYLALRKLERVDAVASTRG